MSSNSYGFTSSISVENREYFIQIIFANTHEDYYYDSVSAFEEKWGSTSDVVKLASKELELRKNNVKGKILCIWAIYGGYTEFDPPDYIPSMPSEEIILNLIAQGKAEDINIDWDT